MSRCYRSITLSAVLLLSQLATAGPLDDANTRSVDLAELTGASQPLAKTDANALYTYTNAAFNFSYTAPSGWSFSAPLVGPTGLLLLSTSNSYTPSMIISAYSATNSTGAENMAGSICFGTTDICMDGTPTYCPWVYSTVDTFYNDLGFGQRWIKLKYTDNHTSIGVTYANHTGQYVMQMTYFTTVTDYNINKDVYFQHFLNMDFVQLYPSAAAKGVDGRSVATPGVALRDGRLTVLGEARRALNVELYDLLGKRAATLQAARTVPTGVQAPGTYIVRLRADDTERTVSGQLLRP